MNAFARSFVRVLPIRPTAQDASLHIAHRITSRRRVHRVVRDNKNTLMKLTGIESRPRRHRRRFLCGSSVLCRKTGNNNNLQRPLLNTYNVQ